MNQSLSNSFYDINTKNRVLQYSLSVMFEKYGIKDFSVSTKTTWNLKPLEIFPSKNIPADKSKEQFKFESIDDLVLYQYIRLENEIQKNPFPPLDNNDELKSDHKLKSNSSFINNYEDGYSYLYFVKEEEPVKSYQLFLGFLAEGVNGLCISKMHPEQLHSSYGINSKNVIQLCNSDGENNVDPKDLSSLLTRINNFIRENGNSVILLDGLDYLITQNGLKKVIEILSFLNDRIEKDSMFILPIHPKALRKTDLDLLEQVAVK